MDEKTKIMLKYGFAILMIAFGLLLNHYGLGSPEFTIYGSIGNFLVFIGFLMLVLALIMQMFRKKKKKVDERMEFVAAKASRYTMVFMILGAFAVMILDGIQPITMPYYLFVSYFVSAILLAYVISYHVLLRRY